MYVESLHCVLQSLPFGWEWPGKAAWGTLVGLAQRRTASWVRCDSLCCLVSRQIVTICQFVLQFRESSATHRNRAPSSRSAWLPRREATLNFKNEPPSPPDPELLARLQGQYKRPHPSTRGTGSMSTGRGAPGQHTLMGQQLPGSFLAGAGLDGAGGLLGQLCDALNVLAGGSQRQDGRGSQAFDGSHAFGGGQQFDAGRATAGAAQDAWLGSLQQPGQQLQQQLQHLLHYQPSAQPATQAPPQQQQLQRAQPPTLFLSLLEEAFEEEGERGEGPTATPQGAGVDAGLDGWAGAGEAGMARSADPPGSSQAQQRQEQQQQQQERSDRTSDTPQLCAVQAAGASEVTGADTDAGVSVAATPGDAGASASEAATEVSAGQAARVVLALSCQSQPDAGQEGYQIEPAAGSAGYQSAAGAPGEATQREAWQQGREEAGPAGMDAEDDVELAGRGEGLERMAWEAAMLWEGQRVYLGQFGCDSEVLPAYERALEYLHARWEGSVGKVWGMWVAGPLVQGAELWVC